VERCRRALAQRRSRQIAPRAKEADRLRRDHGRPAAQRLSCRSDRHSEESEAMTADDFRTLYQYNDWGNHRITSAVRPLDPSAFARDLGNSFGSVRDTLVHIWWGEWIWLERWQGRSPKQPAVFSDFPNIGALEKRWDEVERIRQAFLERL